MAMKDWKEDLYNIWSNPINHYGDFEDFISNLLSEQRAEIVGEIKGMEREVLIGTPSQYDDINFNQSLEDVINIINKDN